MKKNTRRFSEFVSESMLYRGKRADGIINATYNGTDDGMGTFYTDNKTMAEWFAGAKEYDADAEKYVATGNGSVVREEVSVDNPYVIDQSHPEYDRENDRDSFQIYMDEINDAGGVEPYRERLRQLGHDGIILRGNTTNYYEDGTYDIYVVFPPKLYAGQRKVSRDIDRRIRREEGRSEESKNKQEAAAKLRYYTKLMQKGRGKQ